MDRHGLEAEAKPLDSLGRRHVDELDSKEQWAWALEAESIESKQQTGGTYCNLKQKRSRDARGSAVRLALDTAAGEEHGAIDVAHCLIDVLSAEETEVLLAELLKRPESHQLEALGHVMKQLV